MRPNRISCSAGAMMVVIACLSACGTSSSKSSSATVAKQPFVIGSISSISGPAASSLGGVGIALEAWAKTVNASGGINGHQLKLIVKDDAGSAALALSAAKELVEGDHVIAIVGEQSSFGLDWASFVASKGIPVVGGSPAQSIFFTNPDFYPSGASTFAGLYGAIKAGKAAGGGKLAILYCAESPGCAGYVGWSKSFAPSTGVPVVYSSKVSASAPDYTAQCFGAKAKGANELLIIGGSAVALRVADACAAAGLDAVHISVDGQMTRAWLAHSSMDHAIAGELDFPFFDTSTPASAAYADALTRYAPALRGSGLDGGNVAYSWVAGKLFEAAAKAGHLGDNATSAQVKQGLYALKGDTLDGLAPPLTFIEGMPAAVNCSFKISISNAEFAAPNGFNTDCAPTSAIASVVKSLINS
jgi:branched-chain amino acid transport system substrate-binding protein